MKKILPAINILTLFITIVINYLSNTGIFGDSTMASVSAAYPTFFTPAGYAFTIWGLIYLGLAAFVAYQGRALTGNPVAIVLVRQIGGWFVLSCIANSCWILAWIYGYTGLSVILMIVLFFSLVKIILRTNMEMTDPPFRIILFVWWPFCLYSGWISVALIADIAVWLTKIGWNAWGIPAAVWAMIMVVVAGVIHLFMTWRRNMREFAMVGVWALVAVGVGNINRAHAVAITAFIMAGILFVSSSIHGYRNRATSPFRRRPAA